MATAHSISYSYKNGKFVFCKEGVYFALTPEQVEEMIFLCETILESLRQQKDEIPNLLKGIPIKFRKEG